MSIGCTKLQNDMQTRYKRTSFFQTWKFGTLSIFLTNFIYTLVFVFSRFYSIYLSDSLQTWVIDLPVSVISIGSCMGISGSSSFSSLFKLASAAAWAGSFCCPLIWLIRWFFKWPVVRNFLSQWVQVKGFAPKHE